jgi:ABC-type transport system involved in cytochrome c biogenesis ATPase subunit
VSAPVLQRDRELSALVRCLDGVASGRGGLTVISGPLGIGKTTLLALAAGRARERGLTVLTARGGHWRARTRTRWYGGSSSRSAWTATPSRPTW